MSQTQTNGPANAATPVPGLIVLGRDDMGRSHASWFDDTEATLARKAAGLMGMASVAVVNDELRGLADRLPHGRVFSSGKAFVPFVKGDTYRELLGHLSAAERERLGKVQAADPGTAAGSGETIEASDVPTDWQKIKFGSLVLAFSNEDEGWWEAVVVKAASNNLYTLRWRDYPDQGDFVRTRKHIALLHPDIGVA